MPADACGYLPLATRGRPWEANSGKVHVHWRPQASVGTHGRPPEANGRHPRVPAGARVRLMAHGRLSRQAVTSGYCGQYAHRHAPVGARGRLWTVKCGKMNAYDRLQTNSNTAITNYHKNARAKHRPHPCTHTQYTHPWPRQRTWWHTVAAMRSA